MTPEMASIFDFQVFEALVQIEIALNWRAAKPNICAMLVSLDDRQLFGLDLLDEVLHY